MEKGYGKQHRRLQSGGALTIVQDNGKSNQPADHVPTMSNLAGNNTLSVPTELLSEIRVIILSLCVVSGEEGLKASCHRTYIGPICIMSP